jgi:hypothetical protein
MEVDIHLDFPYLDNIFEQSFEEINRFKQKNNHLIGGYFY